eukprot:SAG31_NODE_32723_length_352_cov_0.964427_1_plen_20_part_10
MINVYTNTGRWSGGGGIRVV